ncbi:MAG: nucleotidyl transferase AbiEii/AbiGii toxin family protein [Leptospiraceae bacterium]|nr:nucleotidyl transferase AbiEii/AbiGii toxin family protein [Leptospiraceae bacterium]
MSENYQPILLNKITDEVVIEILNAIIPVFKELKIEYFVVGAFARDLELFAKGHDDPPTRKTNDLDLAVMLSSEEEFNRLKNKLTQMDGFELHDTEPIKIIYKDKYEIDLLPFGEIQNEKGQVELKAQKAFTLDMPGFSEVFGSTNIVKTDQGFELNVCSLPGVVLLKLLAWNDRKHRTKDIEDIENIIRNLYWLDYEEIFDSEPDLNDLLEGEDNNFGESITGRYIGRKIGEILKGSKSILKKVENILSESIQDPQNSKIGKLMNFNTVQESVDILNQIYLGIQDKTK